MKIFLKNMSNSGFGELRIKTVIGYTLLKEGKPEGVYYMEKKTKPEAICTPTK